MDLTPPYTDKRVRPDSNLHGDPDSFKRQRTPSEDGQNQLDQDLIATKDDRVPNHCAPLGESLAAVAQQKFNNLYPEVCLSEVTSAQPISKLRSKRALRRNLTAVCGILQRTSDHMTTPIQPSHAPGWSEHKASNALRLLCCPFSTFNDGKRTYQ